VLAGTSGSVAPRLMAKVVPAWTVVFATALSTGCRFTSPTLTLNARVCASGGTPLSVTRTVTSKVPGPWASVGVHEIAPVLGWMVMPSGAVSRE